MLRNLFHNWKSTSAGITLIVGAIIHIIFLVLKKTPVTEADVMLAVGGILGGIGMIATADASQLRSVQQQMLQVPNAINSGNTAVLEKKIQQSQPPEKTEP